MRSLRAVLFLALWLVLPLTGGDGPTTARAQPRDAGQTEATPPAEGPADKQVSGPGYDLTLGKSVFYEACLACHGKGTAGAPRINDRKAWKPRLKQDLATLIQHALDGHGRMPPKGGVLGLTEVEVASAVAYIVQRSRQIATRQAKRGRASRCDPYWNRAACSPTELRDVMTVYMLWMLSQPNTKQ